MQMFRFHLLICFGIISYALCQNSEFPNFKYGTRVRISTSAYIIFPNQRYESDLRYSVIGTIRSIAQDSIKIESTKINNYIILLMPDINKIDTSQGISSRWSSAKKSALIGGIIGGVLGMISIIHATTPDRQGDMSTGEAMEIASIGTVLIGLPVAFISGIIAYILPNEKWVTIWDNRK